MIKWITAAARKSPTVNIGKESILRISSRSRLNSEFCNVWDSFSSVFSGSQFIIGLSGDESSSDALIVNVVSFAFDVDIGEWGAAGGSVIAPIGVGVLRPVGPAELVCRCSNESEDLRFKAAARKSVEKQKFLQNSHPHIHIKK
jgi:hypothetical protein